MEIKELWLDIKYILKSFGREFRLVTSVKISIVPIIGLVISWLTLPRWVTPISSFVLIFIVLLFTTARRARRLETPNLKAEFNPKLNGCRVKTMTNNAHGNEPLIYFRPHIENISGELLTRCKATLFAMRKDGVDQGYSERTPLFWGGIKGTDEGIDLQGGEDIFLDLISSGNYGAHIPGDKVLKSVSKLHKFEDPGVYELDVRFSASPSISIDKTFYFKWTGNYKTAELSDHPF
jgi:hypothetical protein